MDQLLKVLAALPEDLAVVCSPHIRLVSTLYSHCKRFAARSPGALTHKYVQIYLEIALKSGNCYIYIYSFKI